jgi:hypothetical protein
VLTVIAFSVGATSHATYLLCDSKYLGNYVAFLLKNYFPRGSSGFAAPTGDEFPDMANNHCLAKEG